MVKEKLQKSLDLFIEEPQDLPLNLLHYWLDIACYTFNTTTSGKVCTPYVEACDLRPMGAFVRYSRHVD